MTQASVRPPSGAPQFQAPPPGGPRPPYPLAAGPAAPASQPWPPAPPYGAAGPPPRPAVVVVACTLTVVASLQWICGLSLLWVAATVGTGAFARAGDTGTLFHILNRFGYRMLDGLAVPLYAFPLVSFVAGFVILSPRPWARLLHTAVGVGALAWAAWWLQGTLLWWFGAAGYVLVACLLPWTPGATAWYRAGTDLQRLS